MKAIILIGFSITSLFSNTVNIELAKSTVQDLIKQNSTSMIGCSDSNNSNFCMPKLAKDRTALKLIEDVLNESIKKDTYLENYKDVNMRDVNKHHRIVKIIKSNNRLMLLTDKIYVVNTPSGNQFDANLVSFRGYVGLVSKKLLYKSEGR